MSSRELVVIDGVNYGQRLPRGRHRIPPELVSANQRGRLFGATAAEIAERGYAALSVGRLIDRAHVSRATFYRYFEDKRACVLAAQRWALERLLARIAEACESRGGNWPNRVAAAVDTALEFAARSPGETRLILASGYSPSEPDLTSGEPRADQELMRLLRESAEVWPGAREPEEIVERAAIAGAMSIVGDQLSRREPEALMGLKADLVRILLTPYLGAGDAGRVSRVVEVSRAS